MATRRSLGRSVTGAAFTAAAMMGGTRSGLAQAPAAPSGAPAPAGAPTVRTPVTFDVPPGACDCHTHVFLDPAQYPFAASRVYTPPTATAAELLALQRALRLDRVVIVQPSVYGTDNRATLAGMRELGPQRARGVAVIGPETSDSDLGAMHDAGIRGVRVNLETGGITDPAIARRQLTETAQRIAPRGWHLQTCTRLPVLEALKEQLAALPVALVVDHFGGARADQGVGQPGFATLVDLVKSGKAYVKISGAYRSSTRAPDYADMVPFAKALIEANPDRIVWGTDWPHPDSTPGRPAGQLAPPITVDDGMVLNQLALWAPDAAVRKKILVDNPQRLYGFG